MNFELLANATELIPTLGKWYNREWGISLYGETERESIEKLRDYLNIDCLPLILVAREGRNLMGAAKLRRYEMKELYPDKEFWIGGVFVCPEFRARGIASKLVTELIQRAPAYGANKLQLRTKRLDGGLYSKLGFLPMSEVEHSGRRLLVMEYELS